MNGQNDNKRWIVTFIAILAVLFAVFAACVLGAASGYLIARGQFNRELIELRRAAPEEPEQMEPSPGRPFQGPEDFPFELPREFRNLNGALIEEVAPGSPADEAGLSPGDLVIAVDSQELTPEQGLAELIGDYDPGDVVTLTILHQGMTERDLDVELGENPDAPDRPYLGVRFIPLFMDMQFELPGPD